MVPNSVASLVVRLAGYWGPRMAENLAVSLVQNLAASLAGMRAAPRVVNLAVRLVRWMVVNLVARLVRWKAGNWAEHSVETMVAT